MCSLLVKKKIVFFVRVRVRVIFFVFFVSEKKKIVFFVRVRVRIRLRVRVRVIFFVFIVSEKKKNCVHC